MTWFLIHLLLWLVCGVSRFCKEGGQGWACREKGVCGHCVFVYGAIILLCHIRKVFSGSREQTPSARVLFLVATICSQLTSSCNYIGNLYYQFHGLRLSLSAVKNLRAHGEGPVKRSKNQNCLTTDNRSNRTSKKVAQKTAVTRLLPTGFLHDISLPVDISQCVDRQRRGLLFCHPRRDIHTKDGKSSHTQTKRR